ncbi:hypothetical protein A1D31_37060 [Bradyrhizobium liaoningense]|nr:hypothetical protein A1D31_37060 [Bradyrhizobium liaoningense]
MSQQKGSDLLSFAGPILHCSLPRTDQVTHSFMRCVWSPDLRQFAGTEQAGKLLGIPAVCF